jgi:hypothetical protein
MERDNSGYQREGSSVNEVKKKKSKKFVLPVERYNDYICVTEGYLENWNGLIAAIQNMNELLKDKQEELEIARDAAPPVAQIGQTSLFGGGGANKLTQPEAVYEKIQSLTREIEGMKKEIKSLQSLVNRLDRARMALKPELKRLVEMRYVDEAYWEDIQAELHYSERWCRELIDRAVEDMAIAIFGTKAIKTKSKEKYKFLG